MSTITELNPRLVALTEAGVSVWLDQIRRSMIEGGELARMVSVESLRGVTSNPSIFEKAILGSTDYDGDLRTLARENLDSSAIYEHSAIRAATGAATTFGYGPRYLHSTGQLHKGGPPVGRFLQLVAAPERDAEIPGAGYSFGTLIAAQAAGELETLRSHGLPAERVEVGEDPAHGIPALTERITAILQEG